MDQGQTALTIAAGCFINRRRSELAPERGMPEAYIESERAAPQMIVHDLLDRGAAVDATDADGRTPLMMAAMQGWSGVIRELLARKASVNAVDHLGRTAIDYADPEDRETIGLLQMAGSHPPTGRSGRTVCDAQRALDKLGYEMPIIDCIAGPQFRAALTKFQKDRALQPTGELESATRLELKVHQ
ncbi:MAG: ankyrin repeat domain-containing protein [Bryobacteraceae bacterium]|jgi:hypothetical protein